MSKKNFVSRSLAGVLVFVFAVSAGYAQAGYFAAKQDGIPNQYIVTFKQNVAANMTQLSAADVPSAAQVTNEIMTQYGAGFEEVLSVYENAMEGFSVRMDEATARALADDPKVLMVEQDAMAYAIGTQNNPTWGIDRVDQRDLPLSNSYTYNTTASNVHAYILDTGLNASHNDFSGRVGNGYDAIGDGGGTTDNNGHGTHCAGTVGGTTYGVAKGVTLHAVQVLDAQGSGSYTAIISGVDWVAQNHQSPAVANMSLGGSYSSSLDNAINNLVNSGVSVAVAAGNDNQDACNYSPASNAKAITTGATTSSDSRWSSSNWGNCVDIFAPGSSITSASHTSNSGSSTMSGTSMASPHVCGAAALYLAGNPNASPATVKSALENNASTNKISGVNGSPNLLLYTLSGGTPPPPPPPPPPGELDNGQAVAAEGQKGAWAHYYIKVPSGSSNLVMNLSGGSGDADMYTRFGAEPTSNSWDCRPYNNGNNEECTVPNPQTGTYYISLYGYSAYSGASLVASFDGGTPPPPPPPIPDNSCETRCGGQAPAGCYCDSSCSYYGDCCADKVQFCGN